MTRYAKLTGRKAEYSKSSAEEGRLQSGKEGDDGVKRVASPTLASPFEGTNDDGRVNEVGESSASESKRLMKRVKLLKLKAKKASSTEKKREILSRMRLAEKQAHEANGRRGAEGGHEKSSKVYEKALAERAESSTTDVGSHTEGEGLTRTSASHGISNPWKAMEAERRAKSAVRSAHRREKRIEEREAAQRCYACRQLGHSAKFCQEIAISSTKNGEKMSKGNASATVCCYRCGSLEHSLAKCRKPTPSNGPDLPFAHCFICQQRGHLASKCAENKGRGIYPHGGNCKLCKSVEHLAKDCPLDEAQRTGGSIAGSTASLGWITDVARLDGTSGKGGRGIPADEDDFHAVSRKRYQIHETEKGRHAATRRLDDGPSWQGGMAKKQKVVSF